MSWSEHKKHHESEKVHTEYKCLQKSTQREHSKMYKIKKKQRELRNKKTILCHKDILSLKT